MSTIRATPAARRIACENKVDLLKIILQPGKDYLTLRDVIAQKKSVKISNVAKGILNYYHMDSAALGIPSEDKITKNMVIEAMNVAEKKTLELNAVAGWNGNVLKKPITGVRKIIAQRMVESLATAAQYTLFAQLDADKIKNLSSEIAQAKLELSENKINITDILIKITAAALVKHPLLNSSFIDNEILMHDRINIGLAVALNDGLIVPVIKNASEKSLREISKERKSLVDKARNGKLQPDEYTCGTFTISNIGMYPVDYFTPIINLPESAILGVGRITEQVVPVDGKIEIRSMTEISLTLDHRIIDGVEGAKFLATLKGMFDNPYQVCLTWY